MGGDQAALGIESLAFLNELQRAYVKDTDCIINALPSLQNVETESFRRLKQSSESDLAAAARLGCIRFRVGASAADFKAHLGAGLGLADLYCDDYFRRIAQRKQIRQFGRSTTNDLGTASSVALGLAKAGSILTGGAGALFGLADGIFRNYDAAFVVEPDLGKMLDLVKTAQGSMRDSFKTSPPGSYAEANAAINAYAQLCSYAGMDDLLNVALEAGSDPETIGEVVERFQSTASGLNKPKEVTDAETIEAQVAGLERQKAALDKKKALEAELQQGQPPAEPKPEPVLIGNKTDE
ncbi:MAG TPA: hypothetical protein VFP53_05595 [Sphingomicrobium sp.]|nr:hypothetical protein [Sphingomicrobium sp.]